MSQTPCQKPKSLLGLGSSSSSDSCPAHSYHDVNLEVTVFELAFRAVHKIMRHVQNNTF